MKEVKAGILVFLLFASLLISAQVKINSPYSRYGLGELHGRNVNTAILGMGGISFGVWDPAMINPANPASYATFDSTSFLFEVGIIANFVGHTTTTQQESSNYITLNYVFFGFPVTRWWRTSLGVMPFAKIGYDVNVTIDMSDYEFSDVVNSISGDGGLNQFYWGNGFNITKRFRAGFDAIFIFGEGSRSSMVYFPDSLQIYGVKAQTNTRGSDFIFNYGLQYDIPLKDNKLITLGLIYSNTFYINAKREALSYTLLGGFEDAVETPKDTIFYQPETKGLIILPDHIGLGFMYKDDNRWLIGADFEWQNWSSFESFGQTDSLDDAWRIALGGQYIPKHTSISSLFTRMSYRLGFRYVNSYLSLLGHPIDEYGISFGFGFPLKKSRTSIDLGFEIGRRGTTKDGLIQENFFNISLGVSIFESWFHKRRYR
jgi:long-subunit fatty acid transport protein